MKILFLGQRGIPTLSRAAVREKRVEVLARALAEAGHEVTVTCSKPFVAPSLRSFNGVRLQHVSSLNPKNPGWLTALLALRYIFGRQVVHLQGWRMAALSPIAVLLNPMATFVWTLDFLPGRFSRLCGAVARWTEAACDSVTVPTRELQWLFLHRFGVHAQYVPDGYFAETLPAIPVSRFGLRAGQYCITTSTSVDQLRQVARAYAQSSTRKKLVVMTEQKGLLRRLSRHYPFLHFTGTRGRREELSLLKSAAVVIIAGEPLPHETLLQVMDSKGAIIAETVPRYEETLGVSAIFVKTGDTAGLTQALNDVVMRKERQVVLGRQARRRAKAHFSWARIIPEYLDLYHTQASQAVALDSAQPSLPPAGGLRRGEAQSSFAPAQGAR